MVATAVIGSAVVGGAVQSNAASKAAKAQTNAANQANATQREFFDISQQNLKPYINIGNQASEKVGDLQGLNGGASKIMETLQGLPGYQFANTQGLKSTQNSATSRGLGVSGAAQKAAANYSTGLANQYYGDYLTGLQNTMGVGANAAAGLSSAAGNAGNGIASNQIGAGNARAAGSISQGAALSGALSGIPSGLIANKLFNDSAGGNNTAGIYGNSDIVSDYSNDSQLYGPY
jgi:hypothetical protein